MRAGTDEIQVPVAGVLGAGPEAEDVEEAVAEAEDGALVEIEDFFPARWRVDGFVRDVGCQIGAGACFDGRQDRGAGLGDHGVPVLGGGDGYAGAFDGVE